MKTTLKLLLAALVLANTACANLGRDVRDAPHDPDYSKGATLLDQIPNW